MRQILRPVDTELGCYGPVALKSGHIKIIWKAINMLKLLNTSGPTS